MRRLPGIGYRGGDADRRAWVTGSGLDVWAIIEMLGEFGSPEALVADMPLTLAQVRLAVAYRDAHPDEIAEAIADNARPLDEVIAQYPFIQIAR